MNSGQGGLYLAQNNVRDQVVTEWVKIFGILLGIGLAPLLMDRVEMLHMAKITVPGWLAWIEQWFWLPALVAGLLTILIGVIYSLRQWASLRRRLAEDNPPLVLNEGKLPPRDISAYVNPFAGHTRQSDINLFLDYIQLGRVYLQPITAESLGWLQHALAQPEMQISPQASEVIWCLGIAELWGKEHPTLEEFLKEISDDGQTLLGDRGLRQLIVFREFLNGLSRRLQEPDWRAADALRWIVGWLDYPHVLERTYGPGKIATEKMKSVEAFIEHVKSAQIPADDLPEWVEAISWLPFDGGQSDSRELKQAPRGEAAFTYLQTPTFMIAIGICILLPALVGLLGQQGRLKNPSLVLGYFSSPVIFLWIALGVVDLYPHWQATQQASNWQIVGLLRSGLLKSGLQIAGALVLWTYLGSFFGLQGIAWLFWLAAGLAAAGALLGSLAAPLEPQSKTGQKSEGTDGSSKISSHHPTEATDAILSDTSLTPARSSPDIERPSVNLADEQAAVEVAASRFQVFRGKNSQYYFRLLGRQGEIILASEGYTTRASCVNGILSVKKNAALDQRFERRTAANGERYFVLKAHNQQVIGTSQTFDTQDELEGEIRNVQELAPVAHTENLTL